MMARALRVSSRPRRTEAATMTRAEAAPNVPDSMRSVRARSSTGRLRPDFLTTSMNSSAARKSSVA